MSRCLSNLTEVQQTFKSERRYLKNVTAKTLSWYSDSFRAFNPYLKEGCEENALKPLIKNAVMKLAESGLKPITVNTYLRAINAFLRWLHDEGHVAELVRISPLKQEKKVIKVLTAEQSDRLISYRPSGRNERRVHTIALLIIDTGMRVNEVLSLKRTDIDFDNFLVTVMRGKGQKQRIIPFSVEMRRRLYRFVLNDTHEHSEYIFTTTTGTVVSQRNALRDLKAIAKRAELPNIGFHALRHLYATNYIRSGGNVMMLSEFPARLRDTPAA